MPNYWDSPHLFSSGDTLRADHLRTVIASLERKFNGGITGADFDVSSGKFTLPASLDLMGHELKGAVNVPTGIVNIRSLGVAGTGSGDEGRAMQAAYEKAKARGISVVFHPGGVYESSTTIRVPNDLHIIGSGPGTIFRSSNPDGQTPFFRFVGDTTAGGAFVMRDFRITATNGAAKLNTGILVDSPRKGAVIENVYFDNLEAAVRVTASDKVSLSHIFVTNCKKAVVSSQTSALSLDAIYARTEEDSFDVRDAQGFRVNGVNIRNSSGGHGAIFAACVGGNIQGDFSFNKKSGLVLQGCSGVSVDASTVIGNSALSGAELHPGVLFDGCTGCSLTATVSVRFSTSYQPTYGVHIKGGDGNTVAFCVLTPNGGPDGSETGENDAWAIKDEGSRTKVLGIYRFPLSAT